MTERSCHRSSPGNGLVIGMLLGLLRFDLLLLARRCGILT